MEDIELKVKKIVAEQLGIKEEDIKNESSFIEDLGADSLTTVEMSLALGRRPFGIEIPDTEQENLRTVQQAIDFVKGRRRQVRRTHFNRRGRETPMHPTDGTFKEGLPSSYGGRMHPPHPLIRSGLQPGRCEQNQRDST